MKLFVTVGNRSEPFDRLLRAVDDAITATPHTVQGLCQFGSCNDRSRFLKNVRFLERSVFREQLDQADVVVCHAGVGTVRAAAQAGHEPLVMARLERFGECINDHQLELVRALATNGVVSAVEDATELRRHLRRGTTRRTESAANDDQPAGSSGDILLVGASLTRPSGRRTPGPLRRGLLRLLAHAGPNLDRLRLAREPNRGSAATSRPAASRSGASQA